MPSEKESSPLIDQVDLTKKRTYADFIDLHKGESIIVCGCGTSAALLENPQKYTTIGVNDIHRLFTPDYTVIVDPIRRNEQKRGDHIALANSPVIFSQYPKLDIVNQQNIVLIKLGKRGTLTNLDSRTHVDYSNNSPYMASIIAYHLGAKRIGLIGVDYTDDHFFGETGRYVLYHRLDIVKEHYGALYQAFAERGVEFYNLSEKSLITTVPHLPLSSF